MRNKEKRELTKMFYMVYRKLNCCYVQLKGDGKEQCLRIKSVDIHNSVYKKVSCEDKKFYCHYSSSIVSNIGCKNQPNVSLKHNCK